MGISSKKKRAQEHAREHEPRITPPWGTYRVPSLRGVSCDIDWRSPTAHAHMRVDDGAVTLAPKGRGAQCFVETRSDEDMQRMLCGELNVVTATLQGRVAASGDLLLAVRVAGSLPELGRLCAAVGEREET